MPQQSQKATRWRSPPKFVRVTSSADRDISLLRGYPAPEPLDIRDDAQARPVELCLSVPFLEEPREGGHDRGGGDAARVVEMGGMPVGGMNAGFAGQVGAHPPRPKKL